PSTTSTRRAQPVMYSAPTVHGKVGKGPSSDRARSDVQPGAPAIGKRTLVEQSAEHPAAGRASAPEPVDRSASGLPRLQLKGSSAKPFAMPDGATVQRKAAGEAAADGEPPEHIAARGVAGASRPL